MAKKGTKYGERTINSSGLHHQQCHCSMSQPHRPPEQQVAFLEPDIASDIHGRQNMHTGDAGQTKKSG